MAKQEKKLEEKVRKYRLVFHNVLNITDEDVKSTIKEELNEEVKVDNWEVERYLNYLAKTDPHCITPLPQRDTFVMVKYREYIKK